MSPEYGTTGSNEGKSAEIVVLLHGLKVEPAILTQAQDSSTSEGIDSRNPLQGDFRARVREQAYSRSIPNAVLVSFFM